MDDLPDITVKTIMRENASASVANVYTMLANARPYVDLNSTTRLKIADATTRREEMQKVCGGGHGSARDKAMRQLFLA
jgi:hypothetical protein